MKLGLWSGARTVPALAIIGLITLPAARANLVTNGTFSPSTSLGFNAACTTDTTAYPYGSCSVPSWTGNFEIENGGAGFSIPQPDPGGATDALILQSLSTITPSASQVVDFTTTGTYVLTFYLANRSASPAQTVTVSIDGTTLSGGTIDPAAGSWTLETLTVNETAGNHTLEFAGAVSSVDQSAFVDDVAINTQSSVPEPGSLMLIGTGLLAFAGCLRRKK